MGSTLGPCVVGFRGSIPGLGRLVLFYFVPLTWIWSPDRLFIAIGFIMLLKYCQVKNYETMIGLRKKPFLPSSWSEAIRSRWLYGRDMNREKKGDGKNKRYNVLTDSNLSPEAEHLGAYPGLI